MYTYIGGSNATGEFVGGYSPGSFGQHGFIYNGTYTTFDIPGALSTGIANINDNGDFVGSYQDSASDYHGFLYSGGVLTQLDFPGSVQTSVSGINNAGEIVGSYENRDEVSRGFIYSGGLYTAVNYPVDVPYLQIFAINDSGQMVGGYAVITDFPGSFPNPVVHGFIATPVPTPEPNGAALFGFGAAFLILYARRRKCAGAKFTLVL
jgi:probable HAF family extracellular repeat protein